MLAVRYELRSRVDENGIGYLSLRPNGSTTPEAPMIDDHWDQYVSTIKRPSAVVSKVLPQQKPRHRPSRVAAPRPSNLLLPPLGPPNTLPSHGHPALGPSKPPRLSTKPRDGRRRGRCCYLVSKGHEKVGRGRRSGKRADGNRSNRKKANTDTGASHNSELYC